MGKLSAILPPACVLQRLVLSMMQQQALQRGEKFKESAIRPQIEAQLGRRADVVCVSAGIHFLHLWPYRLFESGPYARMLGDYGAGVARVVLVRVEEARFALYWRLAAAAAFQPAPPRRSRPRVRCRQPRVVRCRRRRPQGT